jgi:hypothetical protein
MPYLENHEAIPSNAEIPIAIRITNATYPIMNRILNGAIITNPNPNRIDLMLVI